MPFRATITTVKDYLRVEVVGEITSIGEIVDYSRRYRVEAGRRKLRCVLLDYRQARFTVDYHDLLNLADYAADANFHLHGLRIAALCSEDNLEPNRQYETIANNRSISYRAFTDKAEAMDWLRRP